MKSIFRISFLALFALAASGIARANWYNHPICTGSSLVGWHSTYTDFNGTDFKSPDAPGGGVPAANLRGIFQQGTDISSSVTHGDKKGGSFPVYQTASHSSGIRGWINVTVIFVHNSSTVISYTFNYTPAGSGAGQGPEYPGATSW